MGRTVLSAMMAMVAGTALSGCGTCFNCVAAYQHGPQEHQEVGLIYGGIRWDSDGMLLLAHRINHLSSDDALNELDDGLVAFRDVSLVCLDLPLCIAADTLTLPFTIVYTMQCRAVAREQDRKVQEASPLGHFLSSPDEIRLPAN
jgi:uncharacterized protein YceK